MLPSAGAQPTPQPLKDEKETNGGEGGGGKKDDALFRKNEVSVTVTKAVECEAQETKYGEQVEKNVRLEPRNRRRRLLRCVIWGYLGECGGRSDERADDIVVLGSLALVIRWMVIWWRKSKSGRLSIPT